MHKYFSAFTAGRSIFSFTTLALSLLTANAARADLSFYYEGKLIYVNELLSNTFKGGHKFRGTITFDETAYDSTGDGTGLPRFPGAIKSITFASPNYQAGSDSGDISYEFEDEHVVHYFTLSASGSPIATYSPRGFFFTWSPDGRVAPENSVFTNNHPLPIPLFNPNSELPLFFNQRIDIYDASGNLVSDSDSQAILDDNLDFHQPFFYSTGIPAPFHGYFSMSFSNGESGGSIVGDLTSITTVPRCNEQPATVYVDATGMIVGGPQDGEVYGGVLNGTAGNDIIYATEGDDIVYGKAGNDYICGLDGDDELLGGNDTDTLLGGAGDDVLKGQGGNDLLFGNAGNDRLNGGRPGAVIMDGGTGYDRCYLNGRRFRCEKYFRGY